MTIVKTKIYAHIDKETLYTKGNDLELSGETLRMFMCFTEIELAITVNEKGEVWEVRALWMVDDNEEV